MALFKRGTTADNARLLGAIEPSNGRWILQAARVENGDIIVGDVLVATSSIQEFRDHIRVELTQLDPTWRSVIETTATLTTAAASGALALPVGGHTRVRPVVTLTPGSLRTTTSTVKGWKYRKTITVENDSGETWDNYGFELPMGNTSTLVSGGKMQADGDDLRVWFEGRELPRKLVAINTTATFVWIVINGLPTGETRTFEIIYGNASATNPPVPENTDEFRGEPIFDEGASDNSEWHYNVNIVAGNAGKGLYWINRGDKTPGRTAHDAPGSFMPFLMLENRDDHNQSRYDTYTDGTLWYQGTLDAERRREGAVNLQDEGIADGLMIRVPTGMTGLECDFRYRNNLQNDGGSVATGKAVIMTRDGGGESWSTVLERSDAQATEITIANTIYSFGSAPYPKELYLGVLPEDEVEIPQNCERDSRVQLRTKTTFRLLIDTSGFTIGALSAEEEIFDCYGTLTLVPGGDAPQYRADLGGAGDSGRLAIPLDNSLVIDGERRTIEEYDGSTLVARREFAGVFVQLDEHGNVKPDHNWLLAKPRANPVVNPSFTTDTTGWSVVYSEITTVFSRDAAPPATAPDGPAARFVWTVNALGINGITVAGAAANLPCLPGVPIALSAWRRSTNAGVTPVFVTSWYDADGVFLGGGEHEAMWTIAANTWVYRTFTPVPPAGAYFYRIEFGPKNRTASPGAGTVWFDEIEIGNALMFTDLDTDVAIDVEWRDSYYG